jgi:hypothetical protein
MILFVVEPLSKSFSIFKQNANNDKIGRPLMLFSINDEEIP